MSDIYKDSLDNIYQELLNFNSDNPNYLAKIYKSYQDISTSTTPCAFISLGRDAPEDSGYIGPRRDVEHNVSFRIVVLYSHGDASYREEKLWELLDKIRDYFLERQDCNDYFDWMLFTAAGPEQIPLRRTGNMLIGGFLEFQGHKQNMLTEV